MILSNNVGGKKDMKKFIKMSSKFLASFGLVAAMLSVNTACFIWWHQSKMPDGIKKLRRF